MDEPDETPVGDQAETDLAFRNIQMREERVRPLVEAYADHMWAIIRREAMASRLRDKGQRIDPAGGPRV